MLHDFIAGRRKEVIKVSYKCVEKEIRGNHHCISTVRVPEYPSIQVSQQSSIAVIDMSEVKDGFLACRLISE